MGTQLAANIISTIAALATLAAVVVAFIAIQDNRKQARENWKDTQQLAEKERQHQGRPILVPTSDIDNFAKLPNIVEQTQQVTIQNIGNGAAFNVHCALYFSQGNRYSSWNNGPVATNALCSITTDNGPDNIGLGINVSVDGKYHLYNDSDTNYRAARLTMTYRDFFEIQHVSIFDYIVLAPGKYWWVQLTMKSRITKDLEDLENDRMPNSRKIKPDH